MSNVKEVKSNGVKITLNDGVERTLKYDLNAMAEMEDRYGSIDAAFEALDANSLKAVRFILWAGLIHENESLTEKQVGALIDVQYLQNIMENLGTALNSDMPVDQSAAEVSTGVVVDPN